MQKQEDAIEGSSLLDDAIKISSEDEADSTILDQLDLILMWIVIALCSKEKTAGLHAILNLITKLFEYLREQSYQMTDFEAMTFLPFFLEKGSSAKGRFKDKFQDLISSIAADPEHSLYSPQKYGQLICIPLLERSGTPKTRLIAMIECCSCVNAIGLSAVGKKGVLVVIRMVSEETLAENRNAALDVITAVIVKMNGDIKK